MSVTLGLNIPLRTRHGFRPLDRATPPAVEEMAFDKLSLHVRARVSASLPGNSRSVFEHYRELLIQRALTSNGLWSRPQGSRAVFSTRLQRNFGTITNTRVWARWEDDVHTLNVFLAVNPTRSLRHALERFPDESYLGAALEGLPFEDFFAASAGAGQTQTLDGNDNAFDDLNVVRSRMGHDHGAAIIGIFERKLRQWVCEVIAPSSLGFREVRSGPKITLASDALEIEIDWGHMSVREAEIYVERRHGNAAHLMNRINNAVLAGHLETDWRHHDVGERGGRRIGSTSIGVRQTGSVTLSYYAKATDRIRGEVRYRRRVRDALGVSVENVCNPLQQLLLMLRRDAVTRLRWDQFCILAGPPPQVTLGDLARLTSLVSNSARRSRVDPEVVLRELLETGGFTQTCPTGQFPRRLASRLEQCGVIHRQSLQPRSRPGRPLRYALTAPYLEAVRKAREGFQVHDDGA